MIYTQKYSEITGDLQGNKYVIYSCTLPNQAPGCWASDGAKEAGERPCEIAGRAVAGVTTEATRSNTQACVLLLENSLVAEFCFLCLKMANTGYNHLRVTES